MEILSENKRYEYPHNLFEIGKIFEGVKDKDSLGVVITGNFTELKQVLDVLFRSLNLEYMVEETEHRSFISGRCGRISAKGKDLGVIGELSPDVLENWGLEIAFSGLELDIERLFDIIRT
jgi:phenylalanyl-tRNA synthetase beta chain